MSRSNPPTPEPRSGASSCRLTRVVIPFEVDASEMTPFTFGTHRERMNTYYASVIATLGTIRRFNPDLACIFATNAIPPRSFERDLASLGAGIEHVRAASSGLLMAGTPFRTSLYLFDVVRAITIPPGSATLYLDPDVICRKRLSCELRDGEVGYLPLSTTAEDSIKGLTLAEIQELSRSLRRPLRNTPVHVGGEALLVTPAAVRGLLLRIDECLCNVARGDARLFRNEEHMLTYAREHDWVSLRPIVARIWTSARYRDVPSDVDDLALWHLPAEKTRGLQRVARAVRTGVLDDRPTAEVRHLLARWTGVTPTLARTASDWIRRQRQGWSRQSKQAR